MASYAAIREPESLKRPLWFSLAFHGALVLLFIGNAIYSRTGNDWGGPGGAITVGVVGSLPAVPLPTPEISTPSRVVDESKGLYKAEPPEAPPIVPPDALPIPKFDKVKPPKYVTRPSKVLENPKPPPPNREFKVSGTEKKTCISHSALVLVLHGTRTIFTVCRRTARLNI